MILSIFLLLLLLLSILLPHPSSTSSSPSSSILMALPRLVPVRYDVQLQLPTASDRDPLVPTFFGTLRMDFQITGAPISPPDRAGDEPLRLTLLAKQLDQLVNCSILMESGERVPLRAQVREPREMDFVFPTVESGGPRALPVGRYTLDIGRFQGLITYGKGLFYRDVGGVPLLGTDLFLDHSPALFPQLGGPLQKTTTKLSLIHPEGTVALSSMHALGPAEALNAHWRCTRFVQAPNIAAHLLALAVLPDAVFERTAVKTSSVPLAIWTNRLQHSATLPPQELARLAGPVLDTVSELLGGEPLPLSVLNMVAIGEDQFNGTRSFGLLLLPVAQWDQSDDAHRIALMARLFARQWLGGMTSIGQMAHFCLQEDLVEWLAQKTVQRLLQDRHPQRLQRFRLAQYVRLQLAETFLAPGESVALPDWAGPDEIFAHCGLKGAHMMASLEELAGEEVLLQALRRLVAQQRYRPFLLDHWVDLLRPMLADTIDLGQVFDFWFRSGGIPNLMVEKRDERLRLRQLIDGRQAQSNGGPWAKMPLWPLAIAVRNLTLPFRFMLSQVLELAPVDRKLIPLTNTDFVHLYRVNYDGPSWQRIVYELLQDAQSLQVLSARARAQLLGDFCYFNTVGQIPEALSDQVQAQFLKLLRDQYEQFELCEFYAFWCTGGAHQRRISMDTESRTRYVQVLRDAVWPALWNGANYECGGPGAASDAGNELCRAAFGRNCF